MKPPRARVAGIVVAASAAIGCVPHTAYEKEFEMRAPCADGDEPSSMCPPLQPPGPVVDPRDAGPQPDGRGAAVTPTGR